MSDSSLQVTHINHGKVKGASPSDDSYYVLVLYDISDARKYHLLVKTLKSYSARIQKSVFEAQLKRSQIRELTHSIELLMSAQNYFNSQDSVRIYWMSGGCETTIFGPCIDNTVEEDLFF